MQSAANNNSKSIYFTERIEQAMDGIFDYPFTLVEAPMGYGKTTAVREHLERANAHVLWQKVHDSSPTVFWNSFSQLFRSWDSERTESLLQLGFPNDSTTIQEAVKLIKAIALPDKTVLVIDDYHLLSNADVNRFIELLVVDEIINLHIVLTARFSEALNIEELSLKGYLNHVKKEAFEFTAQEIKSYYALCGISLKDSEAESLCIYTEGWVSALYLLMLNYKAEGCFMTTGSIYRLVETAVYAPFSQEIKDFLLTLCIFDEFSLEQARHMWGKENTVKLIAEVANKSAFINYDVRTKTYQAHSIFTNFLRESLKGEDAAYIRELHAKAGHWHTKTSDYLAAMHYFYTAGDFENLLLTVEQDKTNSIGNDHKDPLIQYFEECPEEIKERHPVALLIYAMNLMTFGEMELFEAACQRFGMLMVSQPMEPETARKLMGEFELLLSFTAYNNIAKMSEHVKKACAYLDEPATFIDTQGCWTFGSPSVLYLFYRESGTLAQSVQEMKLAMPDYYQLTKGHGMGAEYLMEAEWHFNQGGFEDAEILVHKALYLANGNGQSEIVVSALFLQVRLSLVKGDYPHVLYLFEKMTDEIRQNKKYVLIHTIDVCTGFVNACLNQAALIADWLGMGDFSSSRLYFQATGFSHIVYGRALLSRGENLKLLGISEEMLGVAAVFPNLLTQIYTGIYISAANEQIFRRHEALEALRQALDLAMPDRIYMPFVENGDLIKSLLEALQAQGCHGEGIGQILRLHKPYQESLEKITKTYFAGVRPALSEREMEIAKLAAAGLSNREIGERLFVSQNTVKTQLKSVFAKININSRALLKQYFSENIQS